VEVGVTKCPSTTNFSFWWNVEGTTPTEWIHGHLSRQLQAGLMSITWKVTRRLPSKARITMELGLRWEALNENFSNMLLGIIFRLKPFSMSTLAIICRLSR